MKIDPQRVLVVSPHTDDAEVSSGGTIARFRREGREVHVLVLGAAMAEKPGVVWVENRRAMHRLGISPDCVRICNFPVRRFSEHRQEVLDELIVARQAVQPDLVIAPSLNDMHQDHLVVAQETLRAFKNGCTILGFTYPWNSITFNTSCFVKIIDPDLEKKTAAVQEYRSQEKDYMRPELIRAWAMTNGVAVKAQYAECFEVARLIC